VIVEIIFKLYPHCSGNVVPNGEAAHEGDGQGGRGGRRRFSRSKRPRNSQSDKTGGEKVNNFDN
jgi:hypothetical protein